MEVVEILTHYVDKNTNLISVEFRLSQDDEEVVREDMIEYSFFEEFGYDNTKDFDIFSDLDEEDEWVDEEYDYIDNEDNIVSFLNEYYVVYPNKLPKPTFK